MRALYHIIRADLLERTRQYSFLVMLALVIWIGYLSASGQFRMRVPPDHIGIINSAWVGATMTVTVSFLFGWVGFYIVKGSINRDYVTGVGQIMATTPINRPLYILGKWFSNFIVLGMAILILLLEGIVMNLVLGSESFDLLALTAPLVLIALPCMALVAACVVLFESISWLRGGMGNIIYFFAFLTTLIVGGEINVIGAPGKTVNPYIDFSGWQIIGESISQAAQAAFPNAKGGFAFSITNLDAPKLFLWNGITWTTDILVSRLFFLIAALGLVLLSTIFFDRFNPSRLAPIKKPKGTHSLETVPNIDLNSTPAHLTPLTDASTRFRFGALLIAEVKLLTKGQPWWWYAVSAGLIIAQAATHLENTRIFLIVSWAWPTLLLGALGCRETQYDTEQMIFSAPRPLLNQLPAKWLSAFLVISLMGSGALLRFITEGEIFSLLGWLTGVIWISSLALALGVLTGSSKAFEVIHILWMYLLSQKAAAFDFIGMTPNAPLQIYALLAIVLIGATIFSRQMQLQHR